MGTWLMPKRGLLPALAPDGAGSDLLLRLGPRLALGIRVDPVDLRLPAQLLREEVIDRPRFLQPVQSLHVRGSGGPRGVAVRAAARLRAPAQHVRGRGDSSLDGPSRADHGRCRPRGHQSPCRCARSAGHRQGALAQSGQSSARFHGRRRLRSCGRHLRRQSEACEAKLSMSCAAWRSTSAALWPARCSRGSTSLGRPMI